MDPQDKFEMNPIVFLRDEGVMGVVLNYGAHFSTVRYAFGGIEYEEVRENDDFVVIDNILFRHIEED